MTPAELAVLFSGCETPADYARVERAAQGLPVTVIDPAVLARLAVIFRRAEHGDARRAA